MHSPLNKVREALHAGSWYPSHAPSLEKDLLSYLSHGHALPQAKAIKALIVPHAGFVYSGPTAGQAYQLLSQHLPSNKTIKVFLLGPSHKIGFPCVAFSTLNSYCTPLGDLPLDHQTIQQLINKCDQQDIEYVFTKKSHEENEHSLEMHLPFLAHLRNTLSLDLHLIPLMIGQTSPSYEKSLGTLLAPFLDQEDSLFVISSDFCHWGANFDYYYQVEGVPIAQGVEQLDREGMSLIQSQDPLGFQTYLQQKENTICGRHPISVLLNAIQASTLSLQTQFIHYAQSSPAQSRSDSSVSYAAGVTFL